MPGAPQCSAERAHGVQEKPPGVPLEIVVTLGVEGIIYRTVQLFYRFRDGVDHQSDCSSITASVRPDMQPQGLGFAVVRPFNTSDPTPRLESQYTTGVGSCLDCKGQTSQILVPTEGLLHHTSTSDQASLNRT